LASDSFDAQLFSTHSLLKDFNLSHFCSSSFFLLFVVTEMLFKKVGSLKMALRVLETSPFDELAAASDDEDEQLRGHEHVEEWWRWLEQRDLAGLRSAPIKLVARVYALQVA